MDEPANLELVDLGHDDGSFRGEMLEGLFRHPKETPPKFFYDERGAELYERICELPEYYLTRTEIGILRENRKDIAARLGPRAVMIELGCGGVGKAGLLLEAMVDPLAYAAVDLSRDAMLSSCRALARHFPHVRVLAICADYSRVIELPRLPRGRRVVFFPGSTIGNFEPDSAVRFLAGVARLAGPGGALVLGADLKKDPAVLESAYDDAAGVTAEFNLNILHRMNRELRATFDTSAFRHRALWDEARGRVEMHLVSLKDQVVVVAGVPIHFAEDETIHTESSYKYTVAQVQEMGRDAGFEPCGVWSDPEHRFSVHCLRAIP